MSRRRPSFIGVFKTHVPVGDWVTGRTLAERTHPRHSGSKLSEVAKDYSRRLSNLERYGHVRRRFNPTTNVFEYAVKETPEVVKTSWCPTT